MAQNNTVKGNPEEMTTLGKYEPDLGGQGESLAPHLEINTSNGSCCEGNDRLKLTKMELVH